MKETILTPGCETSAAPVVAPVPVSTLSTPGGRPASRRDAAEFQCRRRSQFRRFENDRVAGRQRGRDFLRLHGHRRIPGGQRRHDTVRLVDGHRKIVAARRRDLGAQCFADRRVVAKRRCGAAHLCDAFGADLAVLDHLQVRKDFRVTQHQIADAMQHGGTLMGLQVAPVRMRRRACRRLHREIDLVGTGRANRVVDRPWSPD